MMLFCAAMAHWTARHLSTGVTRILDALRDLQHRQIPALRAGPLQASSAALQLVAARDLSARVSREDTGDLRKLNVAINDAVSQFACALADIELVTIQISTAAAQVSAGSQSLADGSNSAAVTLQEISGRLQELDTRTRENASNADRALGSMEQTRASTKMGVDRMADLSTAIAEIRASAEGAAKILRTIAEIAAASVEQMDGVRSISVAIAKVSKVTQLATSSAGDSAAAAEELSGQSATMLGLVRGFSLRERTGEDDGAESMAEPTTATGARERSARPARRSSVAVARRDLAARAREAIPFGDETLSEF